MAENGAALFPDPLVPDPAAAAAAAGHIPYLFLDMIYEILLRVPAVQIHRRCRNVCHAWRDLIDEETFIVAYRLRRPSRPLFFYSPTMNPPYDPGLDLEALHLPDRSTSLVLDLDNDEGDGDLFVLHDGHVSFRIKGCCDGIIFIKDLQLDLLYGVNPFTRHWARLPRFPSLAFYAHGAHGDGRQYRVLQKHYVQDHALTTTYSIRALGAQELLAVRPIGRPVSPALLPESALALDYVLSHDFGTDLQGPPVLVNGSLHWLPTYKGSDEHGFKLVAFNTATEEFTWIAPPPVIVETADVYGTVSPFQLLEIQGKLAMAIMDARPGTEVDIWILRDYVDQSWEHMCRINLLSIEARNESNYDAGRSPPLYVSFDRCSGDLHVLVPCPRDLLQCDTSGVILQFHRRNQHDIFCTGHSIDESFIRPPFLTWQGNDAQQPRFHFQAEII